MHVGNYLGLQHGSETQLIWALTQVAEQHGDDPDVYQTCQLMLSWSQTHLQRLAPLVSRYQESRTPEPDALETARFHGPRTGSLALLRDLHDLWMLTDEVHLRWVVLEQAARALRDETLKQVCLECDAETQRQTAFLLTRIKQAAPQTLVVGEP